MRSLFCYRQILRLRLPINGTRRREDDTLYLILWHKFQEIDERYDIVAIIQQWFLYALAYCLACSKVNDTLNIRIFLEYSLGSSLVAQVNLLKSRADTSNLFDTIEYFNL